MRHIGIQYNSIFCRTPTLRRVMLFTIYPSHLYKSPQNIMKSSQLIIFIYTQTKNSNLFGAIWESIRSLPYIMAQLCFVCFVSKKTTRIQIYFDYLCFFLCCKIFALTNNKKKTKKEVLLSLTAPSSNVWSYPSAYIYLHTQSAALTIYIPFSSSDWLFFII